MLRTMMIGIVGATLLLGSSWAQDTGSSLLTAARKRASEAKGKEGQERVEIFEDCLRILALVPEKFPKDKPAVARAWLESGRFQRRLHRPKEAEAAWNKVLTMEGEARSMCAALHELTSLYRKQRKRTEALGFMKRLVEEFPAQSQSRAQALIRMAGLHRDQKNLDQAEACLKQCLDEHGDLWRRAVDALDSWIALKLRRGDGPGALALHKTWHQTLMTRFSGTSHEARLIKALDGMRSASRLKDLSGGGGPR